MIGGDVAADAAFEARYSIPGHAAAFLLALCLVGPALWLLVAGMQNGQWLAAGLGGVGTAFFGPIALAALVRMADRRVRLRITGDAIWLPDHSQTPIPLRSIKQLSDQGFWIALWLYKPARFPPTTRFRRFVKRINGPALREQYGDVWLYPVLFDCSRRELFGRF